MLDRLWAAAQKAVALNTIEGGESISVAKWIKIAMEEKLERDAPSA